MKKAKLIFYSLILSLATFGQTEKTAELFQLILEKDSLLFNIGFNTCDIQQFEILVSDDFEFFHDQAGITPSKAEFIDGIQNGLCKLPYQAKRVLNRNTMQVFPLEKNGVLYGAIQTGEHQFYAIESDKPAYLTSIAKFTHVWLLENGQWKLAKGLSYDHQNVDVSTE